jgi:hypothetical protein
MKLGAMILVAAFAFPFAVRAEDLPEPRPGLWQMTNFKEDGTKLQTSTRCIDAASEARVREFANRPETKEACPKNTTEKKGDVYESYSECNIMGSKTITISRTTGDFNSEYTTTIETTMEPPMRGMAKRVSRSESKWLGECPPNMKPGDVSVDGRAPVNGIDSALKAQKIHDDLMKKDPNFARMVNEAKQGKIPQSDSGGGVRIHARPK